MDRAVRGEQHTIRSKKIQLLSTLVFTFFSPYSMCTRILLAQVIPLLE